MIFVKLAYMCKRLLISIVPPPFGDILLSHAEEVTGHRYTLVEVV